MSTTVGFVSGFKGEFPVFYHSLICIYSVLHERIKLVIFLIQFMFDILTEGNSYSIRYE